MKYLFSLFLFPLFLFAHPHLFMDIDLELIHKDKSLETVKVKWIFDDMSSQMMIMDYDKNLNGKFDKNEINLFKKNVFNDLKSSDYYTHIKINNKKVSTDKLLKNMGLIIENNRFVVIYDLNLKKYDNYQNIKIGFWDKDFFTALTLKKEFVISNNLKFSIKEIDADFYYGYEILIKK
jgi:ABC-type uncharacterized transport system substrate-binding protein